MEQVSLIEHPPKPYVMNSGQRKKLMMEHKPKCLWYCYETEVKADSWNGPQVMKIQRTCLDCILFPCLGNRVTVTGSVAGKIKYDVNLGGSSSSFLSSSHGGAVDSMSLNSMTNPLAWVLSTAYAGCFSRWNFYTQSPNVDFFVASGADGSESLGIHSDHEYVAVKSCCSKGRIGCCGCLSVICCPSSDYKTTVVHGSRLDNGPPIGSLSSGSNGSCFCPRFGGVADIPANASPEDMVQWTMLWGETMSNSGFSRYKGNWKNKTKISDVQQMV